MTKFPLTINGEDLSSLCHKRGYTTSRTPVYGGTYTDLDQVDHYFISRWRGNLIVRTNDLKQADATRLANLLLSAPLQVTYYSFDLGREVTETMMPEAVPKELKLSTPRADWIAGVTLTFTQL